MSDPYGDLRQVKPDPREKYHPVDYEDAVKRYAAGETTVEIGESYGVSSTAIGAGLKRRGIRLRPHWEVTPYPKPMLTLNTKRKAQTHCKRGHEYTEENTLMGPHGRNCRACLRDQRNERRRAQRAKGIKRLSGWSYEKKGESSCRNCGGTERLELHHVIPRSKSTFSRADRRNGVPLCGTCHTGWHARRVTIYRDIFNDDEWSYLLSVPLTGELVEAWLDKNYPVRPLEEAA